MPALLQSCIILSKRNLPYCIYDFDILLVFHAMAKLDLDWLAVFVEIYKTQSVSRAAQALGMEQATASIVLGKLRRHFDDPLFCRTATGMAATPRAQAIYPDLLEAVALLDRARGAVAAFAPEHAKREFKICMTDISEMVLLPRLITHLQQVAPGVLIEAEIISPASRARLESGEADLAIGFTPQLEAGFYQQALFTQDFVCLAARDHPRIGNTLSPQAFCKEGHLCVVSAATGHAIVDKVLAQHGIERRIVLRLPSYLGVARIVAQTQLLVIVPRLFGQALLSQDNIKLLEPPVALPSYAVKQHWHERFNRDAGNIWLRNTLAELFMASPALPA
jgi:DNA-binding transcriptional LysR family regulator